MRILIADDDLGSRLVAQSAVQRLGHECSTAVDGEHAWQILQQTRPQVLISDRAMPGLDGITLCRRLREQEHQKPQDGYTYVVLLTGSGSPDEVTAGMLAGADDYLSKPLNPADLHNRLLAAARITDLHAELSHARAALSLQAHTDPLTGLRNRLGLAEDLEQMHNLSERHGRSFCVAMCDLDRFKAYNDTYGHPAGDQALRIAADTLTSQLRKEDRVYRYGGEEFLVLLPEQGLQGANTAMERVRAQLQRQAIENREAGPPGVLTLSVGLADSTPDRRQTCAQLLTAADGALYQAKHKGRNRVALPG